MIEQNQEQYKSKDILDADTSKSRGELSFLQQNVGKRQEIQQTLLEVAFAWKTDFVLIQEPSVWLNKNTKKWFSFSHPSYNTILQETKERPRTAIYIRKAARIEHKVRRDLSTTGDLLVLEVYRHTERFLILNIYNEKELAEDSSTQPTGARTIKRALLNLQLLSPFLIAGDFNCHHFLWNTAIQTHSQEAATLVQWLQKHSAQLLNAG